MLVLQIAAGVVLAVLVVRFWRQSLLLAAFLAVFAAIASLILWVDEGQPANTVILHLVVGLIVGGVGIRWVVGKVQRDERAVIIVDDDQDSPESDPPTSRPT